MTVSVFSAAFGPRRAALQVLVAALGLAIPPAQDPDGDDRPILLVLGSEGHGLRTLVAKACTEFVRIPSGMGGIGSMEEDDDNGAVQDLEANITRRAAQIPPLHYSNGENTRR